MAGSAPSSCAEARLARTQENTARRPWGFFPRGAGGEGGGREHGLRFFYVFVVFFFKFCTLTLVVKNTNSKVTFLSRRGGLFFLVMPVPSPRDKA